MNLKTRQVIMFVSIIVATIALGECGGGYNSGINRYSENVEITATEEVV